MNTFTAKSPVSESGFDGLLSMRYSPARCGGAGMLYRSNPMISRSQSVFRLRYNSTTAENDDYMITADNSAEIQKLADVRLELVSLKYSGRNTPDVFERLHSITQRLTSLAPPVKAESVRCLEEVSDKLEAFSKNIERLGALIKG